MALLHREHEAVIYLDEDVYVVLGDGERPETSRSAWPSDGTYGPVPAHGVIGHLPELLGLLGPELWHAKRRGSEVCLTGAARSYDLTSVLLWGADCVEHFARRAQAVDGNVVETLALARRYATERQYEAETAQRLANEAEEVLERLRKGGLLSLGRGLLSRAAELDSGIGLLNPTETRYEAGQFATADLRAMQVALMHATKALCAVDPLSAALEASRWCRRAGGRRPCHEGHRIELAEPAAEPVRLRKADPQPPEPGRRDPGRRRARDRMAGRSPRRIPGADRRGAVGLTFALVRRARDATPQPQILPVSAAI
jgi:hypothetical protein